MQFGNLAVGFSALATKLAGEDNPVHVSRLINRQVENAMITEDEAYHKLAIILPKTLPFQTHLVFAEFFNIAIQTEHPERMANFLLDKTSETGYNPAIRPDIQETSYFHINLARILLQCGSQDYWELAKQEFDIATARFKEEPESVNWTKSAKEDILIIASTLGFQVNDTPPPSDE